jgi:hypothetical protein
MKYLISENGDLSDECCSRRTQHGTLGSHESLENLSAWQIHRCQWKKEKAEPISKCCFYHSKEKKIERHLRCMVRKRRIKSAGQRFEMMSWNMASEIFKT